MFHWIVWRGLAEVAQVATLLIYLQNFLAQQKYHSFQKTKSMTMICAYFLGVSE